jgi:alpha-D-ribose 1-methylphosphonate 5-triphosphate synthase subunit PhnH
MTDISAAFGNPPVDAARAFRAILKALSEPGRLVPLEAQLSPPEPLHRGAAAVILTLIDNETPVYLDAPLAVPAVIEWLRFQTGAPLAGDPGDAAFLVLAEPARFDAFERLAIGSADYPDRSATLLLMVDRIVPATAPCLSGPGMNGTAGIGTEPDLPRLWPALQRNHALYPLGFDCLLVAPGTVAGLPRSTCVALEGDA